MASVYGRPDSRFLYVNFMGLDGKYHNKPTPFLKGQEAEAQKLADGLDRRNRASRSGTMTIRAWYNKWIQHRENTTVDTADDESRLTQHVLPHIGAFAVSAVKQTDIQSIFDGLAARCRAKGKPAATSIKVIYSSLKILFKDAVTKGLIERSPVMLMSGTLPKVRQKPPNPYSCTEIRNLLSAPGIPADRHVFWMLLAFAGLRFGEGAALTFGDLDDIQAPMWKMTVTKSYNTRKKCLKTTKTDVVRDVPVHPLLAAALDAWRTKGFVQMFGRPPLPSDPLVPSRRGGHRSSNHMLKRLKQDLDVAGVTLAHARIQHAFRSTFISELQGLEVHRDKLRAITHGLQNSKDVIAKFYTRFKWADLCAVVAQLPYNLEPRPESPDGNEFLAPKPVENLSTEAFPTLSLVPQALPLDPTFTGKFCAPLSDAAQKKGTNLTTTPRR